MKRLLLFTLLFTAVATTFAQDDFALNITDSTQVLLADEDSPLYLIVVYPDSYVLAVFFHRFGNKGSVL